MELWLKISLILCLVIFLKDMVPSDPFVFQYLTEYRDIPAETVQNRFYPQHYYCAPGILLIFLLVTDVLRYKPVIIVCVLAGVSQFATLLWTHGVDALLATSFSSALTHSADLCFYTYIYSKVDRKRFQQVTSYLKSAALFGRCTGALLGQLLIMFNVMNPKELIYISLADNCAGLIVALFLPSVTTSIYFYQKKEIQQGGKQELVKFSWSDGKTLAKSHLRSSFSNITLRLWMFWAIFLVAGFSMISSYHQPLWSYIEPDRTDIYNGFAETCMTLFGAFGALLAAKINQEFIEKWALWILVTCSMCMGSLAIVAGQTTTVFLSYAMYIALGALYQFMLTVAFAIIAKNLVQDSFGMMFGVYGFFATLLLLVYNVIIVSEVFFSFNPRQLYTIFGCYFYVLVVLFCGVGIVNVLRMRQGKRVYIL